MFDDGVVALANALRFNSTLLFPRSADNGIGDVAPALSLLSLFRSNYLVRLLKLKGLGLFKNNPAV